MQIRHRRLLCGISFPDCEESADGKVTFPKPVCRISRQNFGAACMEDLSKQGGEVNWYSNKGLGIHVPWMWRGDAQPIVGPSKSVFRTWHPWFGSGNGNVRGTEPLPESESSVLVSVDGVVYKNYCDADLKCGSYLRASLQQRKRRVRLSRQSNTTSSLLRTPFRDLLRSYSM